MSLTFCLTIDEVEDRFARLGIPARFTAAERTRSATTPMVPHGADLFGFATPEDNPALTLSELRQIVGTDPKKQPSFFDHPWYADEAFMKVPCMPGWHFIKKDVLPDSVGQPLHYIHNSAAQGFELPVAVEVILMLFLHYTGSGEQLLQRKHTWCADKASLNRCVTVGAFGRNGVFLSGHPAGFGSRGLGICPKLRLL